ncbi:MAG: dihydropteroate synthase [Planctomycetota bacterium]
MSTHGRAATGGAFSDVGLALGALALGRGAGREISFLVPRETPVDLWRPWARSERGSASGHGVVFEASEARLREASERGAQVAQALLDAAMAREAPRSRVRLMGIVNVTPDSFSDGGRFLAVEAAVAHGRALVAAGADVLDIGGESTRPGAAPVALAEELQRVLPVIEALARDTGTRLSIDTTKAAVARAAVAAGAALVNDVSAGEADPDMLATVAALGVEFVAMHRQGTPPEMQRDPRYGDPVLDVATHLRRRARAALDAGIPLSRITLDPGIGFGKRLPHNLALLARALELRSLGLPLLFGPSRKSFIAHVLDADDRQGDDRRGDDRRGDDRRGDDRPGAGLSALRQGSEDRIGGTAAAVTAAVLAGADVVRVHDVRVMYEVTRVAEAIAQTEAP